MAKKEINSETQIKEYKRKCKQCKKVWHVLASREEKILKDIKLNNSNKTVAGCGMCAGNWAALGAATQIQRNEQALQEELDRLRKCPNCNSGDYLEEVISYEKK